MSTVQITLIDYGLGNIYSVQRALEICGAEVSVTSDPGGVEFAQSILLPGVGAFADGMRGLAERGLIGPLRDYAASGRPLLGICLGMQMLASVSDEFGEHAGLDLIPGRVTPILATAKDGGRIKIPHVGWSALLPTASADWTNTPLKDTAHGAAVYLVHSYQMVPHDPAHLLASCEYGGHQIVAAVRSGNIFGCQFHPEKSGPEGLRILTSFLRLAAE